MTHVESTPWHDVRGLAVVKVLIGDQTGEIATEQSGPETTLREAANKFSVREVAKHED